MANQLLDLPIELIDNISQSLTANEAYELSLTSTEWDQKMDYVFRTRIFSEFGIEVFADWKLSNSSAKDYYFQQLLMKLYGETIHDLSDDNAIRFTTAQVVSLTQMPLEVSLHFTSVGASYYATMVDFTEESILEVIYRLALDGKLDLQRYFMDTQRDANKSNRYNLDELTEYETENDYIDVVINDVMLLQDAHLLFRV